MRPGVVFFRVVLQVGVFHLVVFGRVVTSSYVGVVFSFWGLRS